MIRAIVTFMLTITDLGKYNFISIRTSMQKLTVNLKYNWLGKIIFSAHPHFAPICFLQFCSTALADLMTTQSRTRREKGAEFGKVYNDYDSKNQEFCADAKSSWERVEN